MNQEKIGNFIRSLRKEKNLTQKELADKLNITDRAISRWERGIGCPDISLLEELSKILDITILELLKGEHLEEKKEPTNINLIESIKFGKENTLFKIKKISNYFIIILITILSSIIIITNIKSIILENKSYNYKEYLKTREVKITTPPTIPINELIKESEYNTYGSGFSLRTTSGTSYSVLMHLCLRRLSCLISQLRDVLFYRYQAVL